MTDLWSGLHQLARNFWWSWDAEATRLFRQIDEAIWEASNHSPVGLLDALGRDAVLQRLHELDLLRLTQRVLDRFTAYHASVEPTARGPVAYFSAEFGVHESLAIYAGGLGVLAGDHCKSASDLNIPMVAVGLLYREGYFTQLIDTEGRQRAYYRRNDVERMGLEPVCDASGRLQQLVLPGIDGDLRVGLWRAHIGRVELILLDTGLWENGPSDRDLTRRLYGGDADTRIRQEILLGVGGVRALRFLGLTPSAFHLNEGHTAFLTLELVRERMAEGESFAQAVEHVRGQCHFTTHTPVPAGHDRFAPDLVERHLGWLRRELGVERATFEGLGRVTPNDSQETFCMTVLALRLCRSANAVSALHGEVSRAMWHSLWPQRRLDDVPIAHVTNGVHIPTWIAPEMGELLDSHMGKDWRQRPWEPEVWEGVDDIPDAVLWAVQNLMKDRLLRFVRDSEMRERVRRHQRNGGKTDWSWDSNAMVIGFARRFATYKRGDLLFRDMERARRLLANPDRPIRLLYSGKAHPHDFGGAEIIRAVVKAATDPVVGPHVTFLPDYALDVARVLVQGVDIWLNTPRRPREASGTSGQKVPFNGGINLSTLDGWWAEAYDGKNGWCIGDERNFDGDWDHDQTDHESLYQLLEEEIVPLYFARDPDGVPRRWVARVKESLRSIPRTFNSHRMVREYAQRYYWPDRT